MDVCGSLVLAILSLVSGAMPVYLPSNEFTLVSWNVDSGGADPHFVALRISEIEGVDLWGLCEVRDERWAALFREAACEDDPGAFASILSPTGGSDRSCILYDRRKFDCLGCSELDWRDQSWYRYGMALRPSLVARLRHRASGSEFHFMVNRLGGFEAEKQAAALNDWAKRQEIPVIAVGTYDFEYRSETTSLSPNRRRGYASLTVDGAFEWLMPINPVRTVSRGDFDEIDDFVLLSGWKKWLQGRSMILVDPEDFPDNEMTPDHRPVKAAITLPQSVQR